MILSSKSSQLAVVLWLLTLGSVQAFVPVSHRSTTLQTERYPTSSIQSLTINKRTAACLKMAMDPVTYLRTEWISAALCTNQTPRSADVVLQLGTQDGRAVTFVPRTVREFITSSAEPDGQLTIQARRQLKQSSDRRQAAQVTYVDQRADDLSKTADESVDVVISLQAAERMMENGLDWKKSIREAARVLKPGGRFLWVEPNEVKGESYIMYLENLVDLNDESANVVPVLSQEPIEGEEGEEQVEDDDKEEPRYPIFDDVGYDNIDLILQPHAAGVAIKSMDAGMSPQERLAKQKQEEKEKMAEISIQAYERGLKKKKRKRKKQKEDAAAESS